MSFKKRIFNLCVSLTATTLCLLALELCVRGYLAFKSYSAPKTGDQSPPVRLHIETDKPFLYGLNPAHPDISSQGTRDDEVAIPKPAGTFRILVLGDSLAYGSNVARDETFPNRLESLLRQQYGSVEVINAGVSGYTPYNELQYYLAKGREFRADVVIVAFCMNDVVNPRLHWGDAPNVKFPDEAIPNHDYDRNHILPKLQKLKEQRGRPEDAEGPFILKHSELYKALAPSVKRLLQSTPSDTVSSEQKVPTYITGEDTLSIEVLLDQASPEWRWLASIYDQLHDAVRADRARLMIAVFPLAYQLDESYPFLPQKQFAEYCARNSIPCLDMLPPFRQRPKEDIFVLNNASFYDIWHLSKDGHELSAEVMLRFMREKELLPASRKTE